MGWPPPDSQLWSNLFEEKVIVEQIYARLKGFLNQLRMTRMICSDKENVKALFGTNFGRMKASFFLLGYQVGKAISLV